METKTLQGVKSENSLSSTGSFLVENSSINFQKLPDKEILRIPGPLTADFTIKVRVIDHLPLTATKSKPRCSRMIKEIFLDLHFLVDIYQKA